MRPLFGTLEIGGSAVASFRGRPRFGDAVATILPAGDTEFFTGEDFLAATTGVVAFLGDARFTTRDDAATTSAPRLFAD